MIEVTLLFLGSVIGAGFATGAEINTFFGELHLPIWCIAIVVGLMMFLMISLEIYLFYPEMKPNNSKPNKLLDVVFIMIYLILFTVMTAGIQNTTNIVICLTSLFTSGLIVNLGFEKLSSINIFFVFIIVVLIVVITAPYTSQLQQTQFNFTDTPQTIIRAILYAGLNCFMFPELIKASAQKHKKPTLFKASLVTSILIATLVGLILSLIHTTQVKNSAIPLLAAVPNLFTTTTVIFAILTSQYTALFAITQRIKKVLPDKVKPSLTTPLICLCGFIGSFFGFNRIINITYPIIGAFICFYLLISFLLKMFFHR